MKSLYMTVIVLFFAGMLNACDKQGPAERAGEDVDNMVKKAEDKIDEATDEPNEGPAEEAGKKIDEAVEETRDRLE